MNAFKLFLLLSIVIFASCKSQKIFPENEPVAQEKVNETGVESLPEIVVKEEKISVPEGEAASLGTKRYYVILGSFSIYDNAKSYKGQLMKENFFPGILVNEKGLYRVCVNSYDDESKARGRVAEIRTNYDKYADVWLLIKSED